MDKSVTSKVTSDAKNGANTAHSRTSGKVTFPDTPHTGRQSGKASPEANRNPFAMPKDHDIFVLRDREKQKKKQERLEQRNLRVHQKLTYTTKVNQRTAAMIKPTHSDEDGEGEEEEDSKALTVKDDPQFTLAVTRDRNVEKESLTDYINKKREMFLVQYSLGVKRDEMRKLEEIAQAEEKKLELAEQFLEEDAAMFDEFLKENDNKSVSAIKAAETETRGKMERVAEIKRINAQMMAIKSEISKHEDALKEYLLYKKFLESLTPKEWLDDKEKEREKKREDKKRLKEEEARAKAQAAGLPSETAVPSDKLGGPRMKKRGSKLGKQQVKGLGHPDSKSHSSNSPASLSPGMHPDATKSQPILSVLSAFQRQTQMTLNPALSTQSETATSDEEDSDEEMELFFDDPHQLLNIFQELEEQNLSLIQNSQETEEALEEMKQTIKNTQVKLEKETKILKEQIDKLTVQIVREEEKAKEYETKSKIFSYGQFDADEQEQMLNKLTAKVEQVYKYCIGENEANINCLQMLTNIENRLEELFEEMEMLPQDKVEAAERMKEKERRLRLREEKLLEQKKHQEERVMKALMRAKAEPKKKLGRKLVERSEPPKLKKKTDDTDDQRTREEEELAYYFSY